MADPTISADPKEPQTMEEAVGYLEQLNRTYRATIIRLHAESEGLHEQIEKLEKENADLDERRETLLQGLSPLLDWYNECRQMFVDIEERNKELEGEVLLLRRRRGSGIGRGRQPEWTKAQAAEVQKRRGEGMSLRRIADETRLTLAQVRTILKPRPATEDQGMPREEKVARRLVEAKRAAAELVRNVTRANQVRLTEETRRKEQHGKKRRRHA